MEISLQIGTLLLMVVFISVTFFQSIKYDHPIQGCNESDKKLVIQAENKQGTKEYQEIDVYPGKEYWIGSGYRKDIRVKGVGKGRFELCIIPEINDTKLILTKGNLKIKGFEYKPNKAKKILIKDGTHCLLGGERYAIELYVVSSCVECMDNIGKL